MRVLIVSNLFPPRVLGGYEILCGQVAAALQRRGHSIEVLTSDDGPPSDEGDPPNVHRRLRTITPFGQRADFRRRTRWVVGRANAAATRTFLAHRSFDVAFIWSQLRLTLGSARVIQRLGLPTVFTFNDEHIAAYLPAPPSMSPREVARFALDRIPFAETTLRGVDLTRVTCISRCLEENLRRAGVDVSGSRVIYQGIPLERFQMKEAAGVLHQPLRLLYVGQLHPYKGVHTVIEAAHQLDTGGGGVAVTILGDGPADYRLQLERLAAKGAAKVDFRGRVPHEELPRLYREHDVLVFASSWQEPFGLTHLEAMASGLPVVSTTEGGPAEFLVHQDNALVFPAEDAGALRASLEQLLQDPELALRLAREGRRVVEQRFTLDRYVADLEALLIEAARGGGK